MSNCLYKLRLTFKGLTMLEMVIALAMMAIIFAAILPQFRNIQNSWASKQTNAEILQNGRIFITHLNRNLAKATRITDVSDPCDATGYIEFMSNDANTYRCEIGANNYVQYGKVSEGLADLAGPVSQLQFTCYSLNDLDTPTTDEGFIRLVKVDTTFTNAATLGQDKNFTTAAYLQTNWFSSDVLPNSSYEFNHAKTKSPVVLNISGNHYLCAYTGDGDDGWAVVLVVDMDTWKITDRKHLEFDDIKGKSPALSKIDDEYYLCTYSGDGDAGWAKVLNVNMSNWHVTTETSLNYETGKAKDSALTKIDDNHYLCAYNGDDDDAWAVVLNVDGATWDITKETPFEFDALKGKTPALEKIDDEHYLCAYSGPDKDKGWAVVLAVDSATWDITKETPFEFDAVKGKTPALAKIDDEHYLCAYSGDKDKGWAVVLTVDNTTWNITKETSLQFDSKKGKAIALAEIPYLPASVSNRTDYLCAYSGDKDHGCVVTLRVDETTWTITKGNPFDYDDADDELIEYEDDKAKTPGLCTIDTIRFLCAYSGGQPIKHSESGGGQECEEKDHGWSIVLNVNPPVEP
jgi:type II secretory pathway pseudopilin PulG